MARVLFVAFIIGIIVLVWRGRDSAHGRAWKRLLLLAFAGLVIFAVLFPAATSIAAEWLGIGRGADLVFYLTSFGLMFLAAVVYVRIRKLEDTIADLVREQALRNWEHELTAPERIHGPRPRGDSGDS